MAVTFRKARLEERATLEALQRRASLSNDAYREDLLAHPEAIDLPAAHIEGGGTIVAERDGEVAGFAVLLLSPDEAAELDGLFVEPSAMKGGIGSGLVAEAASLARRRGAPRLTVVAAPQAQEFYRRCGFAIVGEVPTQFGLAVALAMDLRA